MRIGEVARRSGVSARMLRHYESLGIVVPSGRTSAGYREYGPVDIAAVFHVEGLRALGLSLREVKQALDDPEFAPARVVVDLAERTVRRIERERELLDRLQRVVEAGPGDWEQVLDAVALLSALESDAPSGRQRAALAVETVSAQVLARAVLEESDLNAAGALRWALARSGDDATEVLVRGLADPDPAVRRRAVAALVDLRGDAASGALRGALGDADSGVRAAAVLGLADRGEPDVETELVALIVDGVADVDAAEALARSACGTDRAVELLAARLGDDAAVRRRIAQALGEIGDSAAREVLAGLVDDPDRGVCVTARYLLADR